MDPLPTMEKVLNMTLKLERKINSINAHKNNEVVQANSVQNLVADDENVVAMTSSNNNKKFSNVGGKNVPKCTYCGMNGHTIDKCYKKHGFPPGWIQGYKTKNRQSQDTQQNVNSSISQSDDIGLSLDQFKKLLSLLQGQNQGNQASTNVAVSMTDTGMRPNFSKVPDNSREDYVENCHLVDDIFVKLPNGETVQGLHGMVDGFAKENDGLYLLNQPPVKRKHCAEISSHCNNLTLHMWHNRLGHYPIDKIHTLNGIKCVQFHKPQNFACDVCHFAKH
ncbi:PREDICTED: uncharacterized protein LOC109179759 [Ipomoea nil]|uniref:uncharacterized protein LOC109179759 n=1 Tax=Ipomoea nil TaxID=35883 RepID=UPI0009010ACD|nr:PREDICTED: uncharacterized protein LOC109179759 [Ipomoea nil]